MADQRKRLIIEVDSKGAVTGIRDLDTAQNKASSSAKKLSSSQAKSSKSMKKTEKDSKGLTSSLKSMAGAYLTIQAARAAITAGAVLVADADAIVKTADALGITTEELQKLRFAAIETGASSSDLDTALKFVVKTSGQAKAGFGEAAEAYKILGTNLEDTPENILKSVLNELGQLEDQAVAAALAEKILGEGAVKLGNLSRLGADGLAELSAKAKFVKEDVLRSAEPIADSFFEIGNSIKTELTTAILNAAPAIQSFLDTLNDPASANTMRVAMEALTTTISGVATALNAVTIAGSFVLENLGDIGAATQGAFSSGAEEAKKFAANQSQIIELSKAIQSNNPEFGLSQSLEAAQKLFISIEEGTTTFKNHGLILNKTNGIWEASSRIQKISAKTTQEVIKVGTESEKLLKKLTKAKEEEIPKTEAQIRLEEMAAAKTKATNEAKQRKIDLAAKENGIRLDGISSAKKVITELENETAAILLGEDAHKLYKEQLNIDTEVAAYKANLIELKVSGEELTTQTLEFRTALLENRQALKDAAAEQELANEQSEKAAKLDRDQAAALRELNSETEARNAAIKSLNDRVTLSNSEAQGRLGAFGSGGEEGLSEFDERSGDRDTIRQAEELGIGGNELDNMRQQLELGQQLNDQLDERRLKAQELADVQEGAADALTTSLMDSIKAGESFGDTMKNMGIALGEYALELIGVIIKEQILKAIQSGSGGGAGGAAGSAVGGAIAGSYANGGSVSSGRSYLVGENGPEIFSPGGRGSITPNDQLGGNQTTTNNIVIQAPEGRVSNSSLTQLLTTQNQNQMRASARNTGNA